MSSIRKIGIIDLGSNTARLVVFLTEPGLWFRLVDSIREPVRLAGGMQQGRLSQAAVSRANAALELFADFAAGAELDQIEVIATSAVREAENRDAVLGRLGELGLPTRVLSGSAEAEYGVLAVANSTAHDDAWVVDMGGGSVQLSRMEKRRYRYGDAYPLGALRLSEAYLGLGETGRGATTSKQVKKVEKQLEKHLGPLRRELAEAPGPLVAMGGTVRNLAKIVIRRSGYPLDLLHGYRLRRSDLEELADEILASTPEQLRAMPGLSFDRADLIDAGAIVFRWLLRASGRDSIEISGQGVREGAFYRVFRPQPHLIPCTRSFSVQNLLAHYPQPPRHTSKVVELSTQLFEELRPLHELGALELELLQAAAHLHDIGMTIGYYRHHRYGEQLINAAGLPGFSHRELSLILQMVRYHRKGTPHCARYVGILDTEDETPLRQLTVCLRLAEHLERSRSGRIRAIRAEISERGVALRLEAAQEPTVEIWEAAKDAQLFELAFERALELHWSRP